MLVNQNKKTNKRIGQISSCDQGESNNGSKLSIHVDVQDTGWSFILTDVKSRCLRAAEASFLLVGSQQKDTEASILLANDEFVQALNFRYRGIDQPTNVLAFNMIDTPPFNIEGAPVQLGDIVIARETVILESRQQSIDIADHLTHLVIHGMLHLMGFNHKDDREALEMEQLETSILALLGINIAHEGLAIET